MVHLISSLKLSLLTTRQMIISVNCTITKMSGSANIGLWIHAAKQLQLITLFLKVR